jgi:UDP-GlcNAc3NAcA epimerase
LEEVLGAERPDVVLLYGDTNSTLAGALAAAKLCIPIAHVEAGLRSGNRRMPEEINRILTDRVSQLLFVPTRAAAENLEREGCSRECIHVVGDVMYDAALMFGGTSAESQPTLDEYGLQKKDYLLATVHRAENTDCPERLRSIVSGLAEIAARITVVLPLHPRTKCALEAVGLAEKVSNRLKVIEPVGYLQMLELERHAAAIATDSGGVQKEAFFHGVPCLTLREETEWPETVACGANCLVGAQTQAMVAEACRVLAERPKLPDAGALYGNGQASQRIAQTLATSQLEV